MNILANIDKLSPKIESKYFFWIIENAKPGDVIFTRTPFKSYNLIIPGYWTHCALYLGDNRFQVIDANSNGVVIRTLPDLWTYVSEVAVCSPMCTQSERDEAIEFCLRNVGKDYDFLFRSNIKSFYCSELIYNSYREHLKMRRHYGIKAISPNDLYKDDFFKLQVTSKNISTN